MPRWAHCPECGKTMQRIDEDTFYCPFCSYEEDDNEEGIDVYEAAQIWASNGKDEDYTFGYSVSELEDAL
ncbi:MAG: hypothetical protein J5501_06590 [Ruminococcus sp.]|nr:hypothetical protein [Ruminococcus sp.]